MKDNANMVNKHTVTLPVPFTVTAHAGAMGTRANSVASLRKAVLAGADVVEVDVSLRPNGLPVIIHNSAPSSRQGVLLEHALIEIVESCVQINLDLKSFNTLQTVQQLVEKYRLLDRIFFTGLPKKKSCRFGQCVLLYLVI
jgi:glycerophosphoryl diester phosphodiesterase